MKEIALVYVAEPKNRSALKAYAKLLRKIAMEPGVTLKRAEAVYEYESETPSDVSEGE